jgi:CheY-like chemotaxis protein
VTQAKILLVDDYHDALDMWGVYLRSCGYDVLTAADGLVALEIATSQLPDLIVLDLDLPGITGYEAARRLRSGLSTARIPLIAATGFSHVRQLDEARESGFDAVLVKPCDPTTLVGEIERVLGHARRTLPRPD